MSSHDVHEARLAADAALMAIQDAARTLADDVPWQTVATKAATAAQYAWEATDPQRGQWRRRIAATLLEQGLPQLTVGLAAGVGSKGITEWCRQPARPRAEGVYRSENVGREREASGRDFLGYFLPDLEQKIKAIATALGVLDDRGHNDAMALIRVLHVARRTPEMEMTISAIISALHVGGMSAGSIGSYLEMSGVTVRARAAFLGQRYRQAMATTA